MIKEFVEKHQKTVSFVGGTVTTVGFLYTLAAWLLGINPLGPISIKVGLICISGAHIILAIAPYIFNDNLDIDTANYTQPSNAVFRRNFFFVTSKRELKLNFPRAQKHLERMASYWMYACIIWGIFYMLKGCDELANGELLANEPLKYRATFNFFNALETSMFIYLYYLLSVDTFSSKKGKIKFPGRVNAWIALMFCIIILDIICKYLYSEGKIPYDCSLYFDLLGGLFSGLFFLLFFARLQSKFLNFKTYWIAALFLYGCLQIIFPILHVFLSYDLPAETKSMINSGLFAGFAYAFFAKCILYYLLYTRENLEKFFIYFLSVTIQSQKFENLHVAIKNKDA